MCQPSTRANLSSPVNFVSAKCTVAIQQVRKWPVRICMIRRLRIDTVRHRPVVLPPWERMVEEELGKGVIIPISKKNFRLDASALLVREYSSIWNRTLFMFIFNRGFICSAVGGRSCQSPTPHKEVMRMLQTLSSATVAYLFFVFHRHLRRQNNLCFYSYALRDLDVRTEKWNSVPPDRRLLI